MSNLNVYVQVDGVVDGSPMVVGSKSTPVTFALTADNKLETIVTVADNTTYDVYDADAQVEPLVNWNMLVIVPSATVMLELTCDAGDNVGIQQFVLTLFADIPFILASRVSMANYTDDFAGGSADIIDRIRIRNESGDPANVRVIIAK